MAMHLQPITYGKRDHASTAKEDTDDATILSVAL
jgi:hypothetical protein